MANTYEVSDAENNIVTETITEAYEVKRTLTELETALNTALANYNAAATALSKTNKQITDVS